MPRNSLWHIKLLGLDTRTSLDVISHAFRNRKRAPQQHILTVPLLFGPVAMLVLGHSVQKIAVDLYAKC